MTPLAPLVLGLWLQASIPELVSGELRPQPSGARIASVSEAIDGTAWLGYRVDGVRARGRSCDGILRLEGRGWSEYRDVEEASPAERFILYRIVDGKVQAVRAVGPGCVLDAAGLPLYWLEGVSTGESLRFLDELFGDDERELANQALHALSEHAGEDAVVALIERARSGRRKELRGQALFWLAQRAGRMASDAIVEAVSADPDLDIKKRAVFALAQLPPDEGVPLLIEVARNHPSLEVRKRAFFWLGQSGAAKALALFEEVLLTKR